MSVIDLLETVTQLGGRVTLEAGKLKARVPADRPDLLETLKANRDAVLEHLTTTTTGTFEQLPPELEALIRAAINDALPAGSVKLPDGLITDMSRYITAWGCAYLIGNRADALARLWAVQRVWRADLERKLN
jgi:hypothetical protein